ncbi:hypothetical protein EVAR_68179_1 [Eumeta japonica]|uniref:Uncharacterized protein n=1 Tax=Eumeta variegata TaxID=151549 RepID=A0A4C1ZW86_EUMVA|nr:hypothetical protein EVAR_68179_1 [Eumeta japonica]
MREMLQQVDVDEDVKFNTIDEFCKNEQKFRLVTFYSQSNITEQKLMDLMDEAMWRFTRGAMELQSYGRGDLYWCPVAINKTNEPSVLEETVGEFYGDDDKIPVKKIMNGHGMSLNCSYDEGGFDQKGTSVYEARPVHCILSDEETLKECVADTMSELNAKRQSFIESSSQSKNFVESNKC